MKHLYKSITAKDAGWLALLALFCIATLCVSNIRAIFWDTDFVNNAFPHVDSGKVIHYYINYWDFGFAKRGLVGSILTITGAYPSVVFVRVLGLAIGISVCCTVAFVIYRMRNAFDRQSYLLLAGFLILNPATLQNMGYDLGRFDQLLVLCSIGSLYFIHKGDLLKLAMLTVTGLLIHELYLIMFLPLLLYATMFHSKFKTKEIGYLVGVVGTVSILLFFFGKIESQSVSEIAGTITVENLKFGNVGTIWKNTLQQNIQHTLTFAGQHYSGSIIELSLGGMYTLVVFLLLGMISTFNNLDWRGFPIIVITAIPIFFLGIDYSRWFSLMIINAFIYFFFSVKASEINRVQLTKQHLAVMALLLVLGIFLGPIGIIRTFPLYDFF